MPAPAAAGSELAAPLVAPLNQSFDVAPEDAIELWTEGEEMPPSTGHGRLDVDRIRISADGLWVVRRDRHKGTFPSHARTMEWAQAQFERLQELGLNVISRAMTPSPSDETLLTVTPWLEDMIDCSDETYYATVAPVLNRYFLLAAGGGKILADLRKIKQYSELRGTGEVLLHDPDPYMCKSHKLTRAPIPIPMAA